MKKNQKIYKGLEELNNSTEFEANRYNEFPEKLPRMEEMGNDVENMKAPRRDFLKLMGFGLTAATVAASCEIPVRKAIPYLNKPEEITPGVANWYASTYISGGETQAILVKNREGRPIKIEGNTESSIVGGGTSVRVQGSVLGLYDNTRLQQPMINGEKSDWSKVDATVKAGLNGLGGKLVVLTPSIVSPSTQAVINDFIGAQENATHVKYDAVSASGMVNANEMSFGKAAIPSYDFSKASVIVSFEADFLGDWISPQEFSAQYAKGRTVNKKKTNMSRHFQFEGMLSLTGTNADRRVLMSPSEHGAYVANLYNEIAHLAGATKVNAASIEKTTELKKVAKELWNNKGMGLVVSGSNDTNIQILVNAINFMLDNYGSTLDIVNHANYKQAKDADFVNLVKEMNAGSVAGVIVYDVNPAYDSSMSAEFEAGMKKMKLSVSLNGRMDETASLCQVAAPDHYFLESWGDANPKVGHYSLMQPVIQPLFETRQAQDSLLTWAGNSVSFYEYVRNYWGANVAGNWDKQLHDGVVELPVEGAKPEAFIGDVSAAAGKIKGDAGELEVVLYTKVGMGEGKFVMNPFLQEVPDPVTKSTWDNYIIMNAKDAEKYGVVTEDMGNITVNGVTEEMPVLVLPGQKQGVVAIALGYGREKGGKGSKIGKNVYPMVGFNGMDKVYNASATFAKTHGQYALAITQEHHHINSEKRPVVRQTTLSNYVNDPYAGFTVVNDEGTIVSSGKQEYDRLARVRTEVLYDEPKFTGHHWGMSIDLNSCTGCSACVVACNVENNIPVVGKYEMKRRHDMHWLRIDRYFLSSDSGHEDDGADNPHVIHQPLMCQHCDNAPCENVCPVAATNHSSEGLNQMAYNRCVGTRYCENNCPYKVRRFNWYDYTGQDSFAWNEQIHDMMSNESGDDIDDLIKMVLNPDVTVRSRGVIEKCSFCVQRIQEGKLTAKRENRKLVDGDVKTACQTACPTGAIQFGDLLDKDSAVSKGFAEERNYHVLDEIHVLPSVGYLAKVKNISQEELKEA